MFGWWYIYIYILTSKQGNHEEFSCFSLNTIRDWCFTEGSKHEVRSNSMEPHGSHPSRLGTSHPHGFVLLVIQILPDILETTGGKSQQCSVPWTELNWTFWSGRSWSTTSASIFLLRPTLRLDGWHLDSFTPIGFIWIHLKHPLLTVLMIYFANWKKYGAEDESELWRIMCDHFSFIFLFCILSSSYSC